MRKIILAASICFGIFCSIALSANATEPNQTVVEPEPRCLRIHKITGFGYVDQYHAILNARTRNENYLVQFARRCGDLKFSFKISTTLRQSTVCKPIHDFIVTERDRCRIISIKKVDNREQADEIAAIRATERKQRLAARKAAKKGS